MEFVKFSCSGQILRACGQKVRKKEKKASGLRAGGLGPSPTPALHLPKLRAGSS